jgi:hypothetical protein
MSAGRCLQEAIVTALGEVDDLGVYDGPPTRAPFPYVTLDCGAEWDWSHKNGQGREVGVALTLWDDRPERLDRAADALAARLEELGLVAGWQVVTFRFLRKRIMRDPNGPWAMALDYRARLLATIEGD